MKMYARAEKSTSFPRDSDSLENEKIAFEIVEKIFAFASVRSPVK